MSDPTAARLRLVPVSFADACAFVADWHRHHEPPVGHKFSQAIPPAYTTWIGEQLLAHLALERAACDRELREKVIVP